MSACCLLVVVFSCMCCMSACCLLVCAVMCDSCLCLRLSCMLALVCLIVCVIVCLVCLNVVVIVCLVCMLVLSCVILCLYESDLLRAPCRCVSCLLIASCQYWMCAYAFCILNKTKCKMCAYAFVYSHNRNKTKRRCMFRSTFKVQDIWIQWVHPDLSIRKLLKNS